LADRREARDRIPGIGLQTRRVPRIHLRREYAYKLSSDVRVGGLGVSVRLEYYQQLQDHRLAAPVLLQNFDLYPGLKAILVQFGWRF